MSVEVFAALLIAASFIIPAIVIAIDSKKKPGAVTPGRNINN